MADGRLPLARRLELATQVYTEAALPVLFRITPFVRPADLDARLEQMGWPAFDPTQVMLREGLSTALPPLPDGLHDEPVAPEQLAETVGRWRGTPPDEVAAHAERIRHCPVRYRAWTVRAPGGDAAACAQVAREGDLVGLYDVFTAPQHRGRGLAATLCERLLARSAAEGGLFGYLQVAAENHAARRVYRRIGFADAYAYHYREAPPAAAAAAAREPQPIVRN